VRAGCLVPARGRVPARGLPAGGRLRAGSLCTGYGGLDLAVLAVLDIALAWCADSDRHASAVLAARFPGVPNLGDLTRVDWAAVPPVYLVTAGFPCQDISTAGRGAGIGKGTRSGLWMHIAEGLRCLRPGYVLVENVAALRARGLGRVLADLAALGYDTQWASLRASDAGAAHRRNGIFVLAHQPAALPRLLAAAHPGSRGVQRHRVPGILAGPAGTAEETGP
jgi:DNA (cytosine-5)-methyltransferase 1